MRRWVFTVLFAVLEAGCVPQSPTTKLFSPHGGVNLDNEDPVSSDYPIEKLLRIDGATSTEIGPYQFIDIPGSIIRP